MKMARLTGLILLMVLVIPSAYCWDSEELEMFDLVEEVNENFYDILGISQDATTSEVKKAYRRLSLVLHPDKNDAPDADVKFRQLVAMYDILRDENRRARYNRVLVEGLPDWRDPLYYYRRARKMSLLESSIILTVVISITQYLMAWGSYIDKKQCKEEELVRKYKIKDRKRRKAEDLHNISLMEEELGLIPKPSWWNILPVQLVKLVVFIVTCGPGIVREVMASIQRERERKIKEKEEEERRKEEEERWREEEEERKKEKKAKLKEARKRVSAYPSGGCILEAVDAPKEEEKVVRRVKRERIPVITGGPWTDDEFSELARLMGKYPGGTKERWERIADTMGRTVYEVTRMSEKVKARLAQRFTDIKNEEETPETKVKVKTRAAENTDLAAGSDEVWSPVQQKALEKALKQFPKGTDQRWDRIAKAVPEKTKEECMLRFKYLAAMIKKKKEEAEKQENEQEEENDTEGEQVDEGKSKAKRKQQSKADVEEDNTSTTDETQQEAAESAIDDTEHLLNGKS